jgi:hypothetical protein
MFKNSRDLLKAYKEGFVGSYCDPRELDKLLGQLPHPLFGVAAYDLFGSGKGKLALPFKNLLKFDPGFGPSERQVQGDCRKKDALIPSPDFVKKIQDIKIGDRVYAGDGKITKVISTMAKKSLNPMVKIYTKGGLPLEVTSDHKVLAYRFGGFVSNNTKWKRRYSPGSQNEVVKKLGLNTQHKSNTVFAARKAELVSASELTEADYLLCPLNIEFDTKIPEDMLLFMGDKNCRWMIGLFLGDGHAKKSSKTLEWGCTTDEPEIEQRLCNTLNYLGISWNSYFHCKTSKKARKVYTHKIDAIYNLFKKYFYDENGHKVLPSWAINDDVVEGLIDADGNVRKGRNKNQSDRQEFTNTSPSLVYGIRFWAINNGFIPTIKSRQRTDKRTGQTNKIVYIVSWNLNRTSRNIWRDDEYLAMPITKVELEEGPHEEVYDIGVENKTHTFIDGCGAVIKNCVSHATRNSVDITRSCEIINGEREEFVARGATEGIYGSRGHGGEGMTCSGAAKFVHQTGGILLRQKYGEYDLSTYSAVGGKWGRSGVPKELVQVANKNKVKTISLINTIEQARDALANGYAISVCSGSGFSSRRDKYGIASRSGSWAHAMAWVGMDDTHEIYNETLFLVQNSWGAWNGGEKRHDQPDGSFWIRERDAAEMLRENGSWVFSDVDGFPPRKVSWTLDKVF